MADMFTEAKELFFFCHYFQMFLYPVSEDSFVEQAACQTHADLHAPKDNRLSKNWD